MSLFVILMLLFTAVTGDDTPSLTVRRGDDVTLPCGNVTKDQQNCDRTSWVFSDDGEAVELVTHGNIRKNEKAKAKKLNVAEDCSLVIKNVPRDDVGRYSCRQFRSGEQVSDARVLLNVIDIDSDNPYKYYCHVFRNGDCAHTVQWYYKGDETDISEHQQHPCTAIVSFKIEVQKSNFKELLFCNVTDKSGQTLLCNSISKSSCEKTGRTSADRLEWLPYVVGAAGLAAFFIILVVVVAFIRRKKTKGNKTQRDENIGHSLNPAETQQGPENGQEMAEHEDIVAYASISYTKNGNSKAQDDGDAKGEGVTYSTVKVPSSNTEASVDPSSLYATVNKPNKRETTG